MHQTRKEASIKLPIHRKGTKYIARARSHLNNSVPVVIAIRDMLGLAKTSKEVKRMIQQRLLKVNSRPVSDIRESIKLFNILEAGKFYRLTLSPQGRFVFLELKKPEDRLVKIVSKRLTEKGRVQLNLHDGTNIITADKSIGIGSSLYLDEKNKVKQYIPLEEGKEVFIISGKHQGKLGKILSVEKDDVTIQSGEVKIVLKKSIIVVLK